jgi:3-hydroxyacyl-CoA dehydrogenase/enoyl-CoA hydratase/3-hydroxybutyryl-CoA epimerase
MAEAQAAAQANTRTASSPGALSLAVSAGVARLRIDQPGEKVNVLGASIMAELGGLLAGLSARKDIRCLVVESGKPGVFIAGADLRELEGIADARSAEEKSALGQAIFNKLDDLPFPSVAVLNGAAVGGGLELALACDFRLASDNPRTQLSFPETTLGLLPGWGGTYRLPRLVGLIQALQLILTGRPVDGTQAARIRLVDACYPEAFLEDKTAEFLRAVLTPEGRKAVERRRRGKKLGRKLAEHTALGRTLVFRRARRDLEARLGGHYPGPPAALEVLRRTWRASRPRALWIERKALSRLVPGPVCKNLVRLFFDREAVKKTPALQGQPAPRPVSRAAVLGAGTMGGRIAWLFTRHDIPVVMKDIAWEAVGRGYAAAFAVYRELARRGRLDSRQMNLKMHLLSGAVDYAALGRPDFVVEAVVENLEVKKQVLAETEGLLSGEALIASNTSSLSITEMSGSLRRPERFVGMHFFNPPNLMPLVEIVPGELTSAQTVRAAGLLALALDKTPIVVRDRPGFLVNRLLLPYLNESVRLLEEGYDFPAVDRRLRGFGLPMGPFRLLDEIGIDVAVEVGRVLMGAYGGRMEAASFFGALAGRADLLGTKSGKGFYLHSSREHSPNPEMLRLCSRRFPARRKQWGPAEDFDVVHRPLLSMVNEAARALEEAVVSSARELDLALILGIGFPPFRGGLLRYADELGVRRVRDTLARYAERFGPRFAPAALLQTLAAKGQGFHPA